MLDPDTVRADMEEIFRPASFPPPSSGASVAIEIAQRSSLNAHSGGAGSDKSAAAFVLFGLAIALGVMGTAFLAAGHIQPKVAHTNEAVLVTQLDISNNSPALRRRIAPASRPVMYQPKHWPGHSQSERRAKNFTRERIWQTTAHAIRVRDAGPEIVRAEKLMQEYAEDAAATRRLNLQALHSKLSQTTP